MFASILYIYLIKTLKQSVYIIVAFDVIACVDILWRQYHH